jgi:CRP-like cAMP-binding protein
MTTLGLFKHATDTETYAAGQVIFEAGDAADKMFVVQSGEVEIKVGDRVIDRHGPGGMFGEMGLIDGSPRSATAVAATECVVVPINERRFTFLVQQTPMFALQVMRVMSERVRRLLS